MKHHLAVLVTASALLCSTASHAFHGSISDSNTIQYCSGFCDSIDSLEVGSLFSLTGQMDTLGLDVLNTLVDYTIEITGSSNTLSLTTSNTSLISSNIFTSTDEFEVTTILGGTAVFDTTPAFSAFAGVPSELIYNFDDDSINLYISDTLAASTSPVPIPSAFILFASGAMLLVSFSRRKLIA